MFKFVDAGHTVCSKRLSGGRVPIRTPVCPVDRQQQRRAAGLVCCLPAIDRRLPLTAAWVRAADVDR